MRGNDLKKIVIVKMNNFGSVVALQNTDRA